MIASDDRATNELIIGRTKISLNDLISNIYFQYIFVFIIHIYMYNNEKYVCMYVYKRKFEHNKIIPEELLELELILRSVKTHL